MYRLTFTAFKVDKETGRGLCFTATDKRTLSNKTDIGYDNLVRIFTRLRKDYYAAANGWEVVKSLVHEVGPSRNPRGNISNWGMHMSHTLN